MLKHLLDYSYMSLSDFINSRYAKETTFDNVYINLWSDEYSLKSSMGSVFTSQCLHRVIHSETKKCVACKAYVGFVSEEATDLDYYNNIYSIKSKLKANNIFIRTDRYYPDNYVPTLYGSLLSTALKSKAMYSKTYMISNKKQRTFAYRHIKSRVKNETYYLIHFTKNKKLLYKDNCFVAKTIKPQQLIKQVDNYSKSIIINPYYNEVVMAENVINIISNSKLKKYIERE